MAITYRLMRRDDEAAVLDLWTTVYPGTDRRQWQREWRSIPHCFDHTHVAVAADGIVLATAHYWVRTIRDVHGVPVHVGHVSHVATRPAARRQGHAGTLLELTIAAMQRDRCAWSVLFTSAEAQPLYARYGWRSFPTRYRQGNLAAQRQPPPPGPTVRRLDPRSEPDDWARLAAVYAAYNQRRPLSVVRAPPDWHGYLGVRISNWLDAGAVILGATHDANGGAFCGYAVVHVAEHGFLLNELGVWPDEEGTIRALLAAIAAHYALGTGAGGRVLLPYDAHIDPLLHELFAQVEEGYTEEPMARPIAAEVTEAHLAALFATPGAMFWPLDEV